jgi:hypothetical protein
MCNPRAVLWLLPLIDGLASFAGTMVNVDIGTPKNGGQQTFNRVTTISGVASFIRQGLCYWFPLKWMYRMPV